MTNWFNLDQLRPIFNFGSSSSTFPSKFSINLTPHQCWELVSETNNINVFSITDDGEQIFQLEAGDVAQIEEHKISEEEQHVTEQIAEQVMPDGASAPRLGYTRFWPTILYQYYTGGKTYYTILYLYQYYTNFWGVLFMALCFRMEQTPSKM